MTNLIQALIYYKWRSINMSHLRLHLMGSPRIELDGEAVKLDSRKATALLIAIALAKESQSREVLINLLWPEFDTTRGRTNLRHSLYLLRKTLGSDWLEADRETIWLNSDADIWLDVNQFHNYLAECQTHGHPAGEVCPTCINPLMAALSLYRGDFLSGFGLEDSLAFDDWQLFQTESLRRELTEVLVRLINYHGDQGAYETAIDITRRWLTLDRLNEAAHCQLIQLYAWAGQRPAALRQYQECVQTLQDELGIAPQAETTALYQAIVKGDISPPAARPTREGPLETGALLGDRYRLEAELGHGSLGVVYRARDTLLDRQVAVKVLQSQGLSSASRLRLVQEARAVAKLNHPNIVVVHDVGGIEQGAEATFIVMELVPGEPLSKRPPQTLQETIGIARQVTAALEHAHAHGIIHRDIKPENVLLSADGTAKLMDFGLARTVVSGITQEGAILGTVFYMAPEQALGAELDSRADLYALGVMLYELATGRLPFTGDDPLVVISQHLHAPVIPPSRLNPAIPAELDALILSLLNKKPGDRPASASEVLERLVCLDQTTRREAAARAADGMDERLFPAPGDRSSKNNETRQSIFVARDEELARLHRWADLALNGRGGVVFITGDAGRGKTSLIQEFIRRAQVRWSDLIMAGGNCNAYTGPGDPYLPFREVLGLLTGDIDALWTAGAISREHARRLWDIFPRVVTALVEAGPDLLNTFITAPALLRRAVAYSTGGMSQQAGWLDELKTLVARKATLPNDPNIQQNALFEQYMRVLMALAREHPLLLILDDLQWADSASISLLFHLSRRLAERRILIVGAYRPEEIAIGRQGERHPLELVVHELQRTFGDILIDLDQAEGRQFVEQYLGTEPNRLSAAFRETFYRQTSGHPLFTVELLRGMEERGDLVKDSQGYWVEGKALDWKTLPSRVEAVIAERIARLDPASRQALEIASVEGETFTAEVVAQVGSTDKQEVARRLSVELDRRHRLVRAQEIQHLGARRLSRYRFQHILYQNYLYGSLDPVARMYLHEAVGTALEALYGSEAREIAIPLARHFQQAGIAEKAIEYLLAAGEQARQSSANVEAIAHLNQALEIIKTLPESPERARRELDCLVALGIPLVVVRGHASKEVERAYDRALELSSQVGDAYQRFHALQGLRRFYLHRSELRIAHELGEQLIAQSLNLGNTYISRAYVLSGEILYRMGQFPDAREHLEQALAAYDLQSNPSDASLFGNDTLVLLHIINGIVLWQLGYPDRALRISLEGLARTEQLAHPFTRACGLYFTAEVNDLRREPKAAQDKLALLLPVCQDQGFALYTSWGTVLLGRTQVMQDRIEEGIAQIQQGLVQWRGMGAKLLLPNYLFFLADAYKQAGRHEEGLSSINEAIAIVAETGERTYEAELYRLRGELFLKQGRGDGEVETCFQQALQIARAQSARSWELRAALSLSRLWQKQDKFAQASELLSGIYDQFTEGFDTPDLQEARALLEQLNQTNLRNK
jgi:DNA-binding SARP family transcriptional activator/predicted ATPase